MERRSFLRMLGGGIAATFITTFDAEDAQALASQAPTALRTDSERIFDLSVASGDPSTTGVVLWTHIRPSAYDAATPIWFQIASDAAFTTLVLEGRLSRGAGGPERDHTIAVTIDGQLSPGRQYHYRFIYGDTASRVGRCRTLPTGSPRRVKLGVLSCQDYTNGYYGALRHLAADDSIDFVVHLGDFIYESVGDPRFQDMPFDDRWLLLPSGSTVSLGLDDYRYLYRSYRGDGHLRALLERHTLIVSHDDHEIANDCYWDYARDTLGAPDHPYAEDAGALRRLKREAQRAWLEYIPSRAVENPGETHPHAYSRTYRGFEFGDLGRLSMLDTRTYRTPHPCGEGDVFERYLPIGCSDYASSEQTLLGNAQKEWLRGRLEESRAIWNVIGNQTLLSPLKLGYGSTSLPINVDAWDGYQAERSWLTELLSGSDVANAVILTGDMHSYIASQVLRSYGNLNPLDVSNIVGTEFMTPSITSSNLFETLLRQLEGASGSLLGGLSEAAVRLNNPHVKYFNSAQYGYSTVELTRDCCEWAAYAVDKNVDASMAERQLLARYRKYTWWPWLVEMST
ncbi:alkaline phosphatase D family protein [Sorangium cellulosum]|nr:alkaline phosphatase D family protein [Sorangium cellulosum]